MNTFILGRQGEDKAADYLRGVGYVVLERNWRIGHKEVDLICAYRDKIVIVEVKYRKDTAEYLAELIDYRKRNNLLRAGEAYLRKHRLEKELQFDLVVVHGDEECVEHIPEAIQVFD